MQSSLLYLGCINLLTCTVYGIDKWKAVHKRWRISEGILFGLACIGGSAGALFGMHAFRHKTRKAFFRYGIPVVMGVQIGLGVFFFVNG